MQRNAIRLITRNNWNSHTGTLFKYNNILRPFDINRLQVGCFVYQAFHGQLPVSFSKKNFYFSPSTGFRNRLNSVIIYICLQDPQARLLKILMKIKYREAKQKAGL